MGKSTKQNKRFYQINLKNETKIRNNRTRERHLRIKRIDPRGEDKFFANFVLIQKNRNQIENSKKMFDTTDIHCIIRRNKIKLNLKKGQWSIQEDNLLKEWIKKNGPRKWEQCGKFIQGRSGKQCREHWNNCLNPDLIKGEWTAEEDFLIMQFYEIYKGNWKKIIHLFNGRTDNSIKNRFFSQLRKIAAKNMSISERKLCHKIKLEELKNHLNEAISKAKKEFLNENKMTEEELNIYINKMNLIMKRIISKKIENNESNLSTNFGDLETSEKKEKDNKPKCFIKKRNRDDLSEDINNLDNNKNRNYFKIEIDKEELNPQNINNNYFKIEIDKEELNSINFNLNEYNNDIINKSFYENKDINISNVNNIKTIANNNIYNDDNKSQSSKIFLDSSQMNIFNNIFFEDLDYKYKPSYKFLEKTDFYRADSIGNILIIDNNNAKNNDNLYGNYTKPSTSSIDEQKIFDDDNNNTLFEEIN